MNARRFRARGAPSHRDVRDFRQFLWSEGPPLERRLQTFLEEHPSLVGCLGFAEFATEVPLRKLDVGGRRQPDRADLLATRESPHSTSSGVVYQSTHIIELKSPAASLTSRDVGQRLSRAASQAVEQLHEYRRWLTQVPENIALVQSFGWDVRSPMLYLIMGNEADLIGDPGQLDQVRARFLDQGVLLFTLDDVVRRAEAAADSSGIGLISYSYLTGGGVGGLGAGQYLHLSPGVDPVKAFVSAMHTAVYGATWGRATRDERGESLRAALGLLNHYEDARDALFEIAWTYGADIVASDGSYWIPDEFDLIAIAGPGLPGVGPFLERCAASPYRSHQTLLDSVRDCWSPRDSVGPGHRGYTELLGLLRR